MSDHNTKITNRAMEFRSELASKLARLDERIAQAEDAYELIDRFVANLKKADIEAPEKVRQQHTDLQHLAPTLKVTAGYIESFMLSMDQYAVCAGAQEPMKVAVATLITDFLDSRANVTELEQRKDGASAIEKLDINAAISTERHLQRYIAKTLSNVYGFGYSQVGVVLRDNDLEVDGFYLDLIREWVGVDID